MRWVILSLVFVFPVVLLGVYLYLGIRQKKIKERRR